MWHFVTYSCPTAAVYLDNSLFFLWKIGKVLWIVLVVFLLLCGRGSKLQHIPHSHSITNADNWFQLESRNVMSKSWMIVQSSLIKGSLKRILIFIPIQFGAEKISYLFSCGNFSFVEIKSHLRNIFVLQNTPMYLYDVHNRMIFIWFSSNTML